MMQPGAIIASKYRLESLLGRGGMGEVWRAEHTGFQAPVALKLMDPAVADGSLARFQREANAAARLRGHHVVQILDHGMDDVTGQPFIVMELLEGSTLAQRLAQDGPIGLGETARIVEQVCHALARAHEESIVHRDLKPENIFLVRQGRDECVKVLDFGVAKADDDLIGTRTHTGALLGTPAYMSPEQFVGARDVDGRSDLWSLGVIACECVTGRRPFERRSLGALALAVCSEPIPLARELGPCSEGFERWLERALARDVAARFQTAAELSEALRAAIEASPEAQSARSASATDGLGTVSGLGPPPTGISEGSIENESRPAEATGKPVSIPATSASGMPAKFRRWRFAAFGAVALILAAGLWILQASTTQPPAQHTVQTLHKAPEPGALTKPAGTARALLPQAAAGPGPSASESTAPPPAAAAPAAAAPVAPVPEASAEVSGRAPDSAQPPRVTAEPAVQVSNARSRSSSAKGAGSAKPASSARSNTGAGSRAAPTRRAGALGSDRSKPPNEYTLEDAIDGRK